MIIEEFIDIKINGKNILHYRNLNYNVQLHDIITVKTSELTKGVTFIVNVICDKCSMTGKTRFHNYYKKINNNGIFICEKCQSKKTNLEKYGVENVFQSKEIKDKIKESHITKYGVDNPMKSEICKNTLKNNLIQKYGVENTFQLESSKEKSKNTCLIKYGTEYYTQTDEYKKRSIETNLLKYGTVYSSQNKIIKEKVVNTNIERYGFPSSLQNDIVKEKVKNTCIERYGADNFAKTPFYKETMNNRYGVDSPMQNETIFNKGQKNSLLIKLDDNFNINYQGTFEKHFLDYSFKNNILITKPKQIKYLINGVIKSYYPDFYYEALNLIIEIKSNYTYNKNLEINLMKQKACIEQGYNFIFIIDKKYDEFNSIIGI